MKKRFTKKRCQEIRAGIENAKKRGDFELAIELSQQSGFYSHAAEIAEENGLFQEAYNILQLGKHKNSDSLDKLQCLKDFDSMNKRLFPETSLDNHFYSSNLLKIKSNEKKDLGNWKGKFLNPTDGYLTKSLRENKGHLRFRNYN